MNNKKKQHIVSNKQLFSWFTDITGFVPSVTIFQKKKKMHTCLKCPYHITTDRVKENFSVLTANTL